MTLACGIDVGGTKIAGGVVDEDGTILEELRVESPATDAEAIETAIADLVTELAVPAPDRGGGRRRRRLHRQVPGGGALRAQPRLARRAPQVRPGEAAATCRSSSRTTPTRPRGASSASAPAQDVDDLLLVTVGTGVGGGLVLDGALYRGAFGVGAEIGHMRVVPDGILCGCGKHGCFEQYASGSALVREVARRRRPRLDRGAGPARAGGRRPAEDHRPAGHRGGPGRRRRSRSSSWPSSAPGWARASRR